MRIIAALLTILTLAACGGEPTDETSGGSQAERLGTVVFPVSCSEEASPHMERGLALLHHMMYEDADAEFGIAAEVDPTCALAPWGQAMTLIHPLWSDPPTAEEMARGRELLQQALSRKPPTQRELEFIGPIAAYYEDLGDEDETPRLRRFGDGWRRVHESYPDDPEAATLYAVAILGTVSPEDKTYRLQEEAGAIAEAVLAEHPDHPGAHHYVIHAYDYPPLASRALEVARSYGTIAPEVPHALHMPTHIFTRLGLWDESVEWNLRSAAAASNTGDPAVGALHRLHALDYLTYAYLQQARDEAARDVADQVRAMQGPIAVHPASAYTLAAAPARYLLERRQWPDAARLELPGPEGFDWSTLPAFAAIVEFARGLGAARSGDADGAAASLAALAALRSQLPATPSAAYWAKQIEIQETIVKAWLLKSQGRSDEALQTMRAAAALEASTEKHPVTPGEVLPASELLGDMLLAMHQPGEALQAYRTALQRSPNRFNSLYGAGSAAEEQGDTATARDYYAQLVDVAASADTEREELSHAQAFVAGG